MFHLDEKAMRCRIEFYEMCRNIVLSTHLKEKVQWAFDLTQSPYIHLLKREVASQPKQMFQPSPLGRYPYDLKIVEEYPVVPGRPIHFQIVTSKEMPKRQSLRSTHGIRQLLHALAHIELSAVEIDAAMILAFPQAPIPWVLDWVSILGEEQKHFLLLCGLLKDLDCVYGDFPVHFALWDSARSGRTWLEQIAIVNRYQEACGVDASHALVHQLKEAGREVTASLIDKIHDDEIRHVKIGNDWWKWAFSHYRLSDRDNGSLGEEMGRVFFGILQKRLPTAWRTRVPMDRKGRITSGFSAFELKTMESYLSHREKPIG